MRAVVGKAEIELEVKGHLLAQLDCLQSQFETCLIAQHPTNKKHIIGHTHTLSPSQLWACSHLFDLCLRACVDHAPLEVVVPAYLIDVHSDGASYHKGCLCCRGEPNQSVLFGHLEGGQGVGVILDEKGPRGVASGCGLCTSPSV